MTALLSAATFDNLSMQDYSLSDAQPPTIPGNVSAIGGDDTQFRVVWTASSDDIGVSRYRLYRNGSTTPVAMVPGNLTSYVDRGLSANTAYAYTVSAVDGAGNDSGQSGPPASATTLATHVTLELTDIDIARGCLPPGHTRRTAALSACPGRGLTFGTRMTNSTTRIGRSREMAKSSRE